jgi:deoxyribose-phosphate aldolase
MDYTYLDIAKMIDHSLLNPGLTDEELEAGCRRHPGRLAMRCGSCP